MVYGKLEGQTPRMAHFTRVCDSRRRQRSWQHCQQLGDLLRVAGGDPLCRRHYSTTKRPAAHWPSPLFSGAIWGETYMSSRSRTAAPKPSQSHFASISSKRRRCGAWLNRIPIQGTEEYHSPYSPSNRRNGTIAEKYPSAATTGDKEPK